MIDWCQTVSKIGTIESECMYKWNIQPGLTYQEECTVKSLRVYPIAMSLAVIFALLIS